MPPRKASLNFRKRLLAPGRVLLALGLFSGAGLLPLLPAHAQEARKSSKKASADTADEEFGGSSKPAKETAPKGPALVPGSPEAKAQEIKIFTDRARMAIRGGNLEVGEKLLESLLAVDVPPADRKSALVEVAEVYASKGDAVKTAAIYERLCKELPNDADYTGWLLRLGIVYREAGAYKLATSRFYGVIQMSMKAGSSNFEKYQALTRQAQREIANTYFVAGDFPQAQKFYTMALRSDLPKDDRALAVYRLAHCTFMQNDMPGAVQAFERFLKDFSRHALGAEARYMLAAAYKAQNRPMDAYDTVLELLKDAKAKEGADPKKWAYWQKKAGNEFANDFYQRGDFVNAVTIYQSLAAIEATPEWQWPVVYQMALCFERLRLDPRALEAYKFIIAESEKPENKLKKLPMSIENVVEMARFRAEHLGWNEAAHKQLRTVAGPVVKMPSER
jgi:tetratricopeptide (TPR) repeat protein